MAEKNGIARRESRSGAAVVSAMLSLLPETLTPEIVLALPSITAAAPTITSMKGCAGDCSFGFASRLNASTKLFAVTAWPVLNLKPGRIVKV